MFYFLAAYAVPVLDPDLPSWLLDLCRSLSWITWGIFAVDILVRHQRQGIDAAS